MTHALTIAKKELRGLFQSSIALIFLAVFLFTVLTGFFTAQGFFARGLADVRPMFELLPLLLIFLVSAVTMRAWAEEQRSGTLEVLLTLPLKAHELVLGKFLAGLALVGIALALTLPIPLAVALLGPLDLGPVVGGYLGALSLGAAYLAMGLCVSARTDNQVVALMSTLVLGLALYAVGQDSFTSLFGQHSADLLRSLGTGSRFESIERGVLDVRDLAYYASLCALFLTLNVVSLQAHRLDHGSPSGRAKARQLSLTALLTLANVLALNGWLAPVTSVRIDMTENGDFSLSEATISTVEQLDEPLRIRGFFSERTHPLLGPLVPQIRDLMTEYAVVGGDTVSVSFADPSADDELAAELGEQYSIRPFPFGVSDRSSQSVVNAYFSILIEYGDKYEVLDFQQLIEVQASDTQIDVALRNPEYDLTKTIKKVSQQFESLEVIFAKLPGDAKMTAYITPDRLPEEFSEVAEVFRSVGQEMAKTSRGKLVFTEVNPTDSTTEMERLFTEVGIQPLARDLFGQEVFYLHLVLELGGETQRVLPRGDLTASDLRRAIEAAVKRATPGQMTTLGLFTEQPMAPPPNPQLPPQYQPPPPQPDYRGIQQLFGEAYQVESVRLDDGFINQGIDVLLIGKPGALTEAESFAVDQFLMRGGSVIALAGRHRVDAGEQGLNLVEEPSALTELLATYGVTVGEGVVFDTQHATFPVPRIENRGGFALRRIELVPYALFPDIRGDGIKRSHPATAGLTGLTMPWASPMTLTESTETLNVQPVLSTTSNGWVGDGADLNPDFARYPDQGFPVQAPVGEQILAATLSGRFTSHFADRPNPVFPGSEDAGQGRTLKQSIADGRLAVLSSSEMASDILLQLANDPSGSGAPHRGNLLLLQNLIDWSVEDTDLLSIRGGDAFTRTLVPIADDTKGHVEILVYLMVLFPFLMVVGVPLTRSRRAVPIVLPKENA